MMAVKPSDDPDFLKCMDYVHHTEWEQLTQHAWGVKWKVTDVTVWRWKTKWIKSGLMSACREVTGLSLYDDVKVAERTVVRQVQSLMDSWVHLALYAEREDVRGTALRDLYTLVIVPGRDNQTESGSAEGDYLDFILKSSNALDPMSVALNLDDKVPVEGAAEQQGDTVSNGPAREVVAELPD